MSGTERWELRTDSCVHHRQKDCIGNMVWAWTGLGTGWRVIPPPSKKPKTQPKLNHIQKEWGREHWLLLYCGILLAWAVPPWLFWKDRRQLGFEREIQAISEMLLSRRYFSSSQHTFLLLLQCVEKSKFVYENLVCKENTFSLMCSAFINKTETRQKKGVLIFFFLLKKYILFLLRQIPYFPLPNENL